MKKKLPILDLHGVKHKDVVDRLYDFYFWDGNGDSIIITGNSPEMRDIVEKWLNDNEYVYREEFGNNGRLIVFE